MRYKSLSKKSFFETDAFGGGSGGFGNFHAIDIYAIDNFVPSGYSLLDVGSGNGATPGAIKELGKDIKYKGVDINEDRVKELRKQYPDFEFEVQDGSYLAEPHDTWDVTYSKGTMEYLPTLDIALGEMARVSRKLIIIWFWFGLVDTPEGKHGRLIFGDTLYPDYGHQYSKDEIITGVAKLDGWKIKEFVCDAIPNVTESADLLILENINESS
jgi:SAM-dependent methyltransferase